MVKQDIYINATTAETRIALIENDQLVELFVERPEHERMVGSLYKGVVKKILLGMSAAFVDIGWAQDAFLHFSDLGGGCEMVDWLNSERTGSSGEGGWGTDLPDNQQRRWDPSKIKVGQQIIVQVTKEAIGSKGPRVSSQISVAGRFLVLIPGESYIGISRKIAYPRERNRLKQIISQLRPKGFGLIVRTVAEGRSEGVLMTDLERALKLWRKIEKQIRKTRESGLIHRDMTMASSIIRDMFTSDVGRLVVDSRKLYREIMNYVNDVASNLTDKVHLYSERMPIFDHFGIEKEIEKSLQRKIWLNGGGYIFFDPTEALVAIDVNSGGFGGKRDHEESALKVNLRAAREISRQLRLRDVGGIIVIDFIDLMKEKNREKVFDEMVRNMQADRSKWDIAPLSPFGLMEMTRQRVRPSLLFTFREPCPHCDGTGLVASMETIVTNLERWIKRFVSQTRERRLMLTVHPKVKGYLTGGMRSRIASIMWSNRLFITLSTDKNLKMDEFRGFSYQRKQDVTMEFLTSGFKRSKKKSS